MNVSPISPICPYCGSQAKCVPDSEVYWKGRGGMVWVCGNYPACDTYVGCHKNSLLPFGTLADFVTRKARNTAHDAFDPIWQSGYMIRRAAYSWLAGKLGVPVDDCHIGMFDIETCQRVVAVCKSLKSRKKFKQRKEVA